METRIVVIFRNLEATTFEMVQEISSEVVSNARFLRGFGVHVFHDVDAEKLRESPISGEFDTIVFQFPHVGSREPKYGHNPNHVLVRNFLRSAAAFLKPGGKIMITVVDAPHYDGAFRFEDAAVFAGYHSPEIYPFDPSGFPGYRHSNTNDDESAIKDHRRFATYVFRLKA